MNKQQHETLGTIMSSQDEGDKVVLIIEDHPLYAQAVADALPAGYKAVFATNADAMREILLRETVFIALLDLDLGEGGNGMQLIEELLAANVKPIINSGTARVGQAAACINLGALAYVSKTDSADFLRQTIHKVSTGEDAVTDEIMQESHNLPAMTEREISVLHRLVENPDMTTLELMAAEYLCDGRIRKVVSALLRKLEITTKKREHIADRAVELGYYPGIKLWPMARKPYRAK